MILVVEKGKVVEQGTHDELVRRKGHYEALVHRQLLGPQASSAGLLPQTSSVAVLPLPGEKEV